MHLYWTSLFHQEEGTLSSSLHLLASKQVFGIYLLPSFHGWAFSSLLGSSQLSSEVPTQPWI